MRKFLLFILPLLLSVCITNAQFRNADENAAMQLVSVNRSVIGLSADDLNNVKVSSSYLDKTIGVRYVYLQQTFKDIPVLNQMQVLVFRNNVLMSNAGGRIADIDKKVNVISGMPSISPEAAVMTALAEKKMVTSERAVAISTKEDGRKIEFGKMGVSRENITAQLMWVPSDDGSSIHLAWEVYFIPMTNSDYWMVRVDAKNNYVLNSLNLTVYCNWDDPNHTFVFGKDHKHSAATPKDLFDFKTVTQKPIEFNNGPNFADNAVYRVIPVPYEAPSFMTAPFHATVNNPWTAASANATTLKWHSTDATGTDYNYSRGNNVWAYEDRSGSPNTPLPSKSVTSTTPLPNLTFDFTPDYTLEPTVTSPPNQQFNITNLFYYNNVLHDVLYDYGFTEAGGNFQFNNLGRGGAGNDHVLAEAQDGGGTNNANFATPVDGGSGRMQMYLWTAPTPDRDGDVDNGIVAHEFGHGVSNRSIGGPGNGGGCVSNGESQGEGISDYIALMFTHRWDTATLNGGLTGRGIGTYALNQAITGPGIRSQRYSTDFAINNKVYQAVLPGAVHDRGEHWCAAAWEATWSIIQQSGTISPTIYWNGSSTAGNHVAMRIANMAMRISACGIGFIDHRNGWLNADTILYGGNYSCAIWEAFRKRGMGAFASQGSAASSSDQTPDFTAKSQVVLTASAPTIPEGQNLTYTNTVSTCSYIPITNLLLTDTLPTNVTFVSATAGGTYNAGNRVVSWIVNQGALSSAIYQFTVTVNLGSFPGNVVMRSNLFDVPAGTRRFNVSQVITPITPVAAGCPTVTGQPANTTVCANSPATFSVTASAANTITYQWQVSTTGPGGPWTNLTNVAPYSGVNTATLTINPAALGLNNNQYRCFMVTIDCPTGVNSNAGILTVVATSIGGTVTPANSQVCGTTNSGTLTLSGHVGNIIRWESSTVGAGGPYTPIANTTTTLNYVNLTQTTWYRVVVQVTGCAAVNSSVATVTFVAASPLVIIADPGSTICNGDPTLLTVRLGSSTPIGTLYNQPGAAGNGSPSQVFEPANAAFSSQAADDFVVPAGTTWTVTQLNTVGIGAGNPTSVNVFFYNNSAANLPGTAIASFNNVLTFVRTGGNYTVTLPSSVVLAPGQYWVSFQVNMSFATGGQWFWGNFGTTNILNQYAWQNPGGGFGTPCTSWGYGATGCAVGGGVNRNNIFTIIGSSLTDGGPIPPGSTYLWSPAAGLSSTTTNPVAAAPMVTTTYTVNVDNGAGCVRQASILITVNQRPTVTTHPVSRTDCAGSTATFTVAGTGTNLAYQWQVSTTGCAGPWTNLTNTAPYSGVNTATLTVNPVTALMTGYAYRAVLSGVCAPINNVNISNCAVLTVNPLPAVTVTPTIGCGGVPGLFGTPLTASGAVTYTWAPLAGLYTDALATIPYTGGNAATVYAAPATFTVYTVTGTLSTTTGCSNTATAIINYTPPPPTVVPSSVTMCLGDAAVKLKSSSFQSFSATVNSGAMSLLIPDGPTTWPQTSFPGVNTPNLAVAGIPANATITGMSVRLNLTHTYIADMVIVLKAPNNQVLNLSANVNRTGGPGANFINTVISSASTTPLSASLPPYTGTFQADAVGATYIVNGPGGGNTFPGGPTTPAGYIPTVSNFGGLFSVPNGNYTLGMYDWGFGDLGTLTNWELRIDYIIGVPATSAVWSPAAGLFSDAAATIPYVAGTAVDSVWTRPTPSGVYTYEARVNSLPPPPASFTNPAAITINASGPGTPYPSNLTVSNLPPAGVTVSSVSINGISHTWSDDVDILLQSPSGQNVILMSDVGGATIMNGVNYTFSDAAAIPMGTVANPSGTYRPTNLVGTLGVEPDQWPAPGPGTVAQPAPALSMFTGNMNGIWKLFVIDDFAGDQGNIAGGFTVNFSVTPTPCTSPPRTVIVTVNQPTIATTQPVDQAICTDKVATFTVAAGGSGPFSYQWQVSTNNGNPPWTNIANGGVYSGATTATLTITAPPVSMNGYFYRAVITGAAPCAPAISFIAKLTVNPLPTIVISASPHISLYPGLVTTLSSTVLPNAAATYTWLRNGVAVAGANTGTLVVDIDGLGDYQLRVTDINGCTNISNTLSIKDSVRSNCFIYPNPSSGQFQVRYYSVANNVLPRSLTVYDAKGDRVLTQFYTIGRPYDRMDVDMRKYGKGLYWVEIGDMNGNRLTMCRIVIQ